MTARIALVIALVCACAHCLAQATSVVRAIEVRGQERITREAILAAMRIKPGRPLVPREVLDDETAVRNLGFFRDVKILTSVVSETESDLIVQVSEFPVVREVRVLGNTVVPTETVTEIVEKSQPLGQVWNNRNAQPIRQAITSAYEEKGYFVQIDRLAPQDDSPGTLLVALIEPTVNEIKFLGLRRMDERVLRRLVKTRPGGLLSARQWRKDIEELYFTYWFEPDGVKPADPQPTDTPGSYDLAIEFKEARTGMLNAGVAFDPQSRLVGTLSYSDSNFLGRGQSVGIQLSQATVGGGPSAELAFGNRFYDSQDTALNASVYSRIVYNFTDRGANPFGGGGDADNRFDERRTGGSVSFSRPRGDYRATVGIRAENIRTVAVGTPTQEFIQQDGDLVTLSLGASYDVRRPTNEPYEGKLLSLVVEPGYSNISRIGGNVASFTNILGTNFNLRSTIEYRQYWSPKRPEGTPIEAPRPVAVFRARYGRVFGDVPFFEQMFVGGTESLRGYENQRFWGRQSVLTTFEYRYPIQRAFYLVGFMDYGGAWDGYGTLQGFEQSSRPDLRMGYGLGLGFRVPNLGLLRIDFAFNQEGRNKTHFSFGSSL